ncbi:hypothetical protein FEM48_Zijuj10G0163600 [Ziziphus jujuba var. spinosa]|uniref:Uncharacterized protein n=1 Tax=Ziziphus jujuba var. spinosa TaxID=714518 RepID=A0A978UPF5_ZIZJJ|nr:hypothetical protein FEM48_Zijuj10G0163600 [Ziziphus jujuba var. spinosa]
MEFCLKVATEGIQKQVIRDANKNVVMSASSLNLLLNMAALGSSGKTLKQSLGCLGSETITNLRSKSSYLMLFFLTRYQHVNIIIIIIIIKKEEAEEECSSPIVFRERDV